MNPGKAATYSLSRHDVLVNRIIGFIAGVATTIIAQLLGGLTL